MLLYTESIQFSMYVHCTYKIRHQPATHAHVTQLHTHFCFLLFYNVYTVMHTSFLSSFWTMSTQFYTFVSPMSFSAMYTQLHTHTPFLFFLHTMPPKESKYTWTHLWKRFHVTCKIMTYNWHEWKFHSKFI